MVLRGLSRWVVLLVGIRRASEWRMVNASIMQNILELARQQAEPAAGFWGVPTSTVDWCEKNYEVSPYICEWFNTVSSLSMLVVGLLGFWLHRRTLEKRFLASFLIVSVVGIGSLAFHATLRFELQMLDEVPMLYSVILMVYVLVENQKTKQLGRWFPALLIGYAVFVTYLCAFTRGQWQFFLFQFSFGSLEFWCLYRVTRITQQSKNRSIRRLFGVGMSFYVVAMALWFLDLRFCQLWARSLPARGISNPQLHAWWHVLVSGGLYLLVVLIAFDRFGRLGRNPALRRRWGVVPCIEVSALPVVDPTSL